MIRFKIKQAARQTVLGLLASILLFATCGFEQVFYCCTDCEAEGVVFVLEGKCHEDGPAGCCPEQPNLFRICQEPGCDVSGFARPDGETRCGVRFVKAELESVQQRNSYSSVVSLSLFPVLSPVACRFVLPDEAVLPEYPVPDRFSFSGGRQLLFRIALLLI